MMDRSDTGKQKERPEPRNMMRFLGIAAEVAQDTTYIRNTRIPNPMKHFPNDPLKRTVDKYFRDAVGGPLYIDEPTTALDIKYCEEKAKVMRIERARYAYIAPDMDIGDVRAQLETYESERGVG